jgi:HSP20 family molecular chaperone IbpA
LSIERKHAISEIVDRYFEELEHEFEQWGRRQMDRPSWNQRNCTIEPLHDMKITPTEVVVTVDLPLTFENKVQVKPLDENTLEISAEMKRKVRFSELGITHCEGEFQKLHCHSRVPVPVRMSKMKIKFKKGILEVHLPRKRRLSTK